MATLLEKIEASAAARLTLPAGALPAQELPRYRNFLKVEFHRVKMMHRARAGGSAVCRARAAVMDTLLKYLWDTSKKALSTQAQKEFPGIALVALGGYGRAELNPNSDIDFMFLHDGQVVAGGKPLPHLSKVIDGTLYPLWDLGFKIGHSVRTISEAIQIANSDMQSKTSLIEARLITGDPKIFEKFQKTLLAKCVEGQADVYIAARIQDQNARRDKFGNSPTMQEPNVKNGCGGLRDFQNLHWMAFFKYRTRGLEEMQKEELITASERKQLENAYDFLLMVRTELHYQAGRAVDVLSKSLQPAIATQLGYSDRSPRKRLEAFMRDYYTHSRNIYLITRTIEDRLALLPQTGKLASLKQFIRVPFKQAPVEQIVDGFKFKGGKIHAGSGRIFKEQPRRLMRAFLHAQQRGLSLHPDLAQQIRGELPLVNREFLKDEHVRETFLEILNRRGDVARVLRAMHEVGLLGKYIPEFGKLTCLVQHEFYHQYTADEHTLVCLEQVDRIWGTKEPPYGRYAVLFEAVDRPFLLYLALLLHDAGKADDTGKHSEVGGQIALQVAKRLHLDGATAHTLRLIIEHHLTMAQVSQRRDLDDPQVIRQFAGQIQSRENLQLLTLHTFADSQATSSKLWNDFKDTLLWELYHKTARLLEGTDDFIRLEEKQKELLAEEVKAELPRFIGDDEVAAHFEKLPPRYFQIRSAKSIGEDLSLVHRFMHNQIAEEDKALEPVISWHNEADRGYTSAKICTWDRVGLFYKIAGSFSAAGINILSAEVFTRADGIVLDTFSVTEARGGGLVNREERERFEGILSRALIGEQVDLEGLIGKMQKNVRPLYQSVDGERMPTRIHFDNNSSDTRSVIDIETEDRLGLLYEVSKLVTEFKLDIALAKISTEKGAAIDSFYVSEQGGAKISDPARQREIENAFVEALKK